MSIGSSDAAPALVLVVARSGGFAGLTRRWRVEARDEADAAEWRPLVDACPWQASAPDDAARDRFVYRITLRDAGATTARGDSPVEHEATLPESSLEGPWRALVERVQEKGEVVPAGRRGGSVER